MAKISSYRVGLVLFAVVAAMLLAIVEPRSSAQTPGREWEKAAGGKMAFEVASVKPAGAGQFHFNFPLTIGASNFAAVGNLMSVEVPMRNLIGFAYKFSMGQMGFLISGLPDWVNSKAFDIEARAPIEHPTKDQFRLMTQALLADRFKLVTHVEKREVPIYALVLTKPGSTGPQLRAHVDDGKCSGDTTSDAANATFSDFPCGSTFMGRANNPGRVRGGGRDVSLDYVAAFLTGTGFQGTSPDRPVLNQTGLTESYDFWIEFAPEPTGPPPDVQPDPTGPSLAEALRDQLGVKLVAKKEAVDVLIVDHIEEPTAN